ncbi:hypothetical protein HYS49_00310 [Candidatus Woesearchaeota archaeon]|nr:hypothetical protein [Candidatus Woesearchaeota archaeon]
MSKIEKYRTLHLFWPGTPEPQFTVLDEVSFEGMAPREFYLPTPEPQKIAKHYGISPPDWVEKIANLKDQKALESSSPLEISVNWITPPDVMACRAGKIKIAPLQAVGITTTKDNKLMVGLRGGELVPEKIDAYARGFYGMIPGGTTTWNQTENPVKETLRREFGEEIGPFDCEIGKLIGIAESTGRLPGINFYVLIKTDATGEQIQKVNRRANEEYRVLKEKKAKPAEIEAELRKLKLPVDCWESDPILSIPNDQKSIEQVLEALRGSFIGPALGALDIYAKTLKHIN